MTTLMQWGNSEGVKGHCDARCHNAKKPKCDCMCGGRYHGLGGSLALDDAIKAYGAEIEAAARAKAAKLGMQISFAGLPLE